MNLEHKCQRLHLLPVSLFRYTHTGVERGEFPNVLAVEEVQEWAGGCNVRGNVWEAAHPVGHLALCRERIKVGLFLRGDFLMEQGKAFPVSCLFQVLWKLRVSFPRAEV